MARAVRSESALNKVLLTLCWSNLLSDIGSANTLRLLEDQAQ